jgi:hypothetical protein
MSIEPKPVRDLLITAIETNDHHGVGILLQRMFGQGEDFVCLRTTSQHGGHEPFGSNHHELCSRFLTDAETEHHLKAILALYQIRRILVVPYYREESVHGVLAKRLTGAPLCTYLMDDQNIFAPLVPDGRVQELLAASDLRLGISPEMCAAYTAKFGMPVHLLPPLAEPASGYLPNYWQPEPGETPLCAMLGNVWTDRRFTELRQLVRSAGLRVHWYGNGPKASWLTGSVEEWEVDGIESMGYLPEEDLIASLAAYPFVLVPSGSLDANDDNPAFSQLSLPSRLVFLHARTDTPVLLLGSPETAAGRFISKIGSGLCARHDAADLARCAKALCDPTIREQFRDQIRHHAPRMTMPATGAWIWNSLANRNPLPAAFDDSFSSSVSIKLPPLPGDVANMEDHHTAGPLGNFAISRSAHFRLVPSLATENEKLLELSIYEGHLAAHLIANEGDTLHDVLFIGESIPAPLEQACAQKRLWRIKDLQFWQLNGYSGDATHLECANTQASAIPEVRRFDAILSTGWVGSLPDDYHAHEGLSLFLAACTRANGINAHWFSAVLHPTYFWVSPVYQYLLRRFRNGSSWPGLDDFQHAADPYFMSESAYNQHWLTSTGKPYAEFGRPFALMAGWRMPA